MNATCHPERPTKAKGLCSACYDANHRRARNEPAPAPRIDPPDHVKARALEAWRRGCKLERVAAIIGCALDVAEKWLHARESAARPARNSRERPARKTAARATCHPEREAISRGLCRECYDARRPQRSGGSHTEDDRAKISRGLERAHARNPRTHSAETRARIAAGARARWAAQREHAE